MLYVTNVLLELEYRRTYYAGFYTGTSSWFPACVHGLDPDTGRCPDNLIFRARGVQANMMTIQ
jgi:hypothetical protein